MASREKHLLRGFFVGAGCFAEKAFKPHTNFFNLGVVGEATSC